MIDSIIEFLKHFAPVLISGIAAFVLSLIIFWILRISLKKSKGLNKRTLIRVKKPAITIGVISALYSSAHWEFGSISTTWEQAFQIAFILCFSWLLVRLLAVGRDFIVHSYDITIEDNLRARKIVTQIRVFERIILVVIVIIAVALTLMTFDSIRSVGASILASAGIAGIVIGLAAQKVIANLLAGFQIAIAQPIRLDDVVIIEGQWGWIEEITLTYVVVRIWDKRRLIVPSTQVIEKPFENWTRNSSEIMGTVFIYTDYRMPVEPLRKEFDRILKSTDLWDQKVGVVQVTNLTDRAMEIRALMSAKNSPTAWDLRVHVREKLIEFLQKEYPEHLPKARVELHQD